MTAELEQMTIRRQGFQDDFVIGLVLDADIPRAYYFTDVERLGAINDTLGDIPVLVWASDDIYQAYIRQVDGQTLTFSFDGEKLGDEKPSPPDPTWA